jgi:outer membrane lipoprotein-sorting protein
MYLYDDNNQIFRTKPSKAFSSILILYSNIKYLTIEPIKSILHYENNFTADC